MTLAEVADREFIGLSTGSALHAYLGERALGYPDPGAEAVAVVLDALARG